MSDSQRAPVAGETGRRARVAALLDRLADREGLQATFVQGVEVARMSRSEPCRAVMYEPMLLFLGQGRKRARFGDEVVEYDPENYLTLAVPVPAQCEVVATPAEPLLGVKVSVDPALLARLLVELDDAPAAGGDVPRGIQVSPLTAEVGDALLRLLECLTSPADSRILGRQIIREIVYRVLQDEPGGALRALATRDDHFMRIARVLKEIDSDYARPLSTDDLARQASMSVSTFHHHFKAVTATTPLQYLKRIRLHRARLMMVHSGHNASTAAAAVGYQSASQFGREFKRLFGASPAEEAAAIRSRLAEGVGESRDRWR